MANHSTRFDLLSYPYHIYAYDLLHHLQLLNLHIIVFHSASVSVIENPEVIWLNLSFYYAFRISFPMA